MRAQYQFVCPLDNGLHARPASLLADVARPFRAVAVLSKAGAPGVELLSVLSVIGLDVKRGDACTLDADGEDADLVIDALRLFIEHKLEASETAAPAPAHHEAPACELPVALRDPAPPHATGRAVCSGIGLGAAVIVGGLALAPKDRDAVPGPVADELAALARAMAWVREDLTRRASSAKGLEAELLRAHAAIASDPALTHDIEARVRSRLTAAQAVVAGAEEFVGRLRTAASAYIRDRVIDVIDVCSQVVARLTGGLPAIDLLPDSVVFAEALTAGQLLAMDKSRIRGLVLGGVGATSHTVILARSFRLPTVIDVRNAAGLVAPGRPVILDAEAGLVLTDPTPDAERFYRREQAAAAAWLDQLGRGVQGPVATTDGQRIEVGANASTGDETAGAVRLGADGVGLVRTELLFLDRETAPTEQEQFEAYAAVVRAANSGGVRRPVIIRTFDIGGDKPAHYLRIPREENPFLGVRGLRLYPGNPEVLTAQLRAILRASALGPVKIMAPMVATAEEAAWFRARVREVQAQLRSESLAFDESCPIGVMLEIPAVAHGMPELCAEADFFSIGSNDLCQYWMAVDRGNPGVAKLYSPLQPSFLRLLKQIVDGAKAGGRWIGMCGEMGGKVEHLPLLLGLGLDEISAAPGEVAKLKSAVATASAERCRELFGAALACRTPAEVAAVLAQGSWRTPRPVPVVSAELIVRGSGAPGKADAIKEAVDVLYAAGRVDNPRAVERAIWAREATYSTGLGYGFAVPHCKSEAVTSPSLAVVTLARPVEWGSMDGEPVGVVMMLVVPASDASGGHMKVFAKLARRLMHEEFRDRVRGAGSGAEIESVLREELGL